MASWAVSVFTGPAAGANMSCHFDYGGITSITGSDAVVRLSGVSKALILAALSFMGDEWRWSNGDQDTIDAAVAQANLEVMETNMLIGSIIWVAGSPPTNTLLCDGGSHARADYPVLYGLLDSVYIIDADNFRVPDLRGRFVAGAGASYAVGDTGGSNDHTLLESEIPSHTHGYTVVIPNVDLESPGAPDAFAGGVGPTVQTGATGGGQPHENRPPFEALNPCLIAV